MMSVENANTNELYSLLPQQLCQELEKYEQTVCLPQGASLMKSGVLPKGLVILNSGSVQVSVPCSRRSASMTTAQKGKVFGMRAAIAGEPPEIDVTCLEECHVTIVPREAFLDVLRINPQIYFAVAKVLSGELQIANQILSTSVRRHATPRVRAPRVV